MNRLAQQTSPYLLQHAANPVDWWPWCDQAQAAAREQNKPILLSIGYSACHWCHVMAHESFEDPETARVMNERFINIKVDREERPDLDHIYQTAHLLLSQRSGGWPLTMFLTPDGTPFFSGTYFPPSNRHGLPGFTDVLMSISDAYTQQRKQIEEQNLAVIEALQKTQPKPTGMELDGSLVQQASDSLLMHFDKQFGGFGRAPKFPHCPDLALLMRSAVCENNALARHACLHTLRCMAQGGLYDQLGGGFARYSVDGRWAIPHFEKMLYDNGALLGLYAEAFALTGETLFSRTVSGTVQWVLREMQSPEGAFYAALDADSEGEEGKFYVWDRAEVASLLDKEHYTIVAMHYGLDQGPNFEEIHWHFHIAQPLTEVALALGMTETRAQQLLDEAQGILLAHRSQRIRPGCDDKILTSWNALMISGMARASAVMKEKTWLQSAQRAMDFIRQTLWRDDRLLATYKSGEAHLNAYLDDHAFLIDAALSLMQTEFRRQDLDFALKLADTLLSQFEDKESGGFFFTRHDHEALVLRPKPAHDSAMASGNGMAALVLQRLGHLVGRTDYLQAAERTLKLFHPSMQTSTMGYGSMSMALAEYASPPEILILRGEASQAWLHCLHTRCMPSTLCVYLPDEEETLPAALDKPRSATAAAWLCRGTECLPCIHTYAELLDKLDLAL